MYENSIFTVYEMHDVAQDGSGSCSSHCQTGTGSHYVTPTLLNCTHCSHCSAVFALSQIVPNVIVHTTL